MTNEEAILGLREIKEAGIIPSYIEEPMGCEGIAVDADKMFDLAIKAIRIVELIEKTFKRDGNLMMDVDDWKEVKEAAENEMAH